MRSSLHRSLIPALAAACLLTAGLAPPLLAADAFPAPLVSHSTTAVPVFSGGGIPGSTSLGLTEAELHQALPGRNLVRVHSGEFSRVISTHGSRGRLITGPALAALLASHPRPAATSEKYAFGLSSSASPQIYAQAAPGASTPPTYAQASAPDDGPADPAPRVAKPCAGLDSLARHHCLDSLTRARSGVAPRAPRALREIDAANRRDTVYIGPDGRPIDKASVVSSADPAEGAEADENAEAARKARAQEEAADEVQQERTRGYFGQFFVDLSHSTGDDWDWDGSDWAVILYVVIGVIVVGAFVLVGAKAIYDLVVNKDEAPVFKEVGARFSYSGLTMYGDNGEPLYRDAYLAGLRFAFGVDKEMLSLGLALEGGSINLRISGLEGPSEAVDFRGGYLVGGPMVRFGHYHPLALTLEFLNGTSDHRNIGWISKTRMMLAARSSAGLLVGAHLGAVFYDLKASDGLVFRRGDLNRDLSVMVGLDAGWAF